MIIPDYQLQSLRTQGYAQYRVPTVLEQVQKTWADQWQEGV